MKINRIYLLLFLILFIVMVSWIASCKHNPETTTLSEICFEGDVLPIFKNSCTISGCHDGQGESHLVLYNYLDITKGIVPGKPYSSRIYKSLIGSGGESRMPPGPPLSLTNRTIIRVWIEQGAKLTLCPDTSGTGGGGGSYVNPRACFTRDILPVLTSKCASTGCHDVTTHQGDYIFASYSTTMNSVSPGNPGRSKLYSSITNSSGEDIMPPSAKSQLTIAEIDSIRKWISYGALNEVCGEVCDTINPVTFSGTIWPIIQSSCTGCHSGASPSGNVSLASYNNVATVASAGTLIKALKGNGVTRMPPSGIFSACRIRQFEIWINAGYLNN